MSVFRFFKANSKRKQPTGYFEPSHFDEPRLAQNMQGYQPSSYADAGGHSPYVGQNPYPSAPYPREAYHGDYQEPHAQGQASHSHGYQGQERDYGPHQHYPSQQGYVPPSFSGPQQTQGSAPPHGPQPHYTQPPLFQNTAANYAKSTGGQDLRELRFWDKANSKNETRYSGRDVAGYGAEEEDEPQPLRFVFALGILIIFAALAWLVFKWSTHSVSTTPPHIQADQNPFKVRPDNPGGMVVPHQDKLVYNRIGNEGNAGPEGAPVERLLPPPEQPLHPSNVVQAPPVPGQQMIPQGQPMQNGPAQGMPQPTMQGQQQMAPAPYGATGGVPQQQPQGPVPPHQPMMQGHPAAQPYAGQGQPHQGQPQAMVPPQGNPAGFPQQPMTNASQATQGRSEFSAEEEGMDEFYPNNIPPAQPVVAPQQPTVPSKEKQDPKAKTNGLKKEAKETKTTAKKSEQKLVSLDGGHPTGFMPGGLPQQKNEQSKQAQQPSNKAKATASPASPEKSVGGAGAYRVKLASVGSRVDAEKEWERLRLAHRDSFQDLEKSILEKKSNGRTYFVVYANGVNGQNNAREICNQVGAGCAVEKQ